MKTSILCAIGLVIMTGCVSPGRIISAMAKDPASVHVKVSTIYGTIEVTRTNPTTNSLPHTVSNDGAIKVDSK